MLFVALDFKFWLQNNDALIATLSHALARYLTDLVTCK